ncbi:hypothetical protein DW133_03760 [Sutterella sp. AM11-39]|nr:hypothetical protein DW133_03760 [Sutterella sp. AM11-39]
MPIFKQRPQTHKMRALALALQSKCPIATLSGCLDPFNVRSAGAFFLRAQKKDQFAIKERIP